ncbi:MAG: YigZ family protein [Bacteroidales bacterium]|nr:YigZ family protein [Bacteroidales bacterium]
MLLPDKYLSIAAQSEGLFKDSGSRFIAYAYPISSESDVKPIVDRLRAEHHGARHHCFSYRIAKVEDTLEGPTLAKEGIWRANDDGEPSGTAGRPILGQIDSKGLQNVLVVVVRYFGGILLGVPGLIRAYKSATADALEKAQIVEKTATRRWSIEFGYELMPAVMGELKAQGLELVSRDFAEQCSLTVDIPLSKERAFLEHTEKIGIFKDKIKLTDLTQ